MVVELRYASSSETLYLDAKMALQDLQESLEVHGLVPADCTAHNGTRTDACWAWRMSARAPFSLAAQQRALLMALQLLQAYLPGGELTKRQSDWIMGSGIAIRLRFCT
jgi:hypothetical protein